MIATKTIKDSNGFFAADSSSNRTAKRFHDPTLSNRAFAIFFVITILIAAALLLAPKARAVNDLYWDSDTANNGGSTGTTATGTWGTSAFWNTSSTGAAPGSFTATTTNTNDVHFSASTDVTGTYTVTISGAQSANSIIFEEGALTLSGGTSITLGGGGGVNSGLLFVSGTNANTISTALVLGSAAAFTNNDNSLQTITGGVTGAFNLTLNGSGSGGLSLATGSINNGGTITNSGSGTGTTTISAVIGTNVTGVTQNSSTSTLVLSGANNTYTGATTISAGVLAASSLANGGSPSSIGASSNAATNLVLNGGTFRYTGAAASTDRLFSIGTSGGTLEASGSGAVNFTNTGAMGFNSQTGARTLTLAGTNTGNNTLAAVIGDNGGATSLTKSDAGTWILSGNNTYSGNTIISAGTLTASGGNAIGDSSAVSVTGTLNLNNNETIGSLAGSGNVTLNANRLSAGEDDTSTTFSGAITGSGGLTKIGSGTLTLFSNATNTYGGSTIINGGTLALQFPNGNGKNDVLPSGNLVTFGGGALTLTGGNQANSQTLGNLTFNSGANAITLNAGGGGPVTLTAGNTWTRSVGSTLNITLNSQTFTSNPTLVNSVLPYATVAGANWATVSGGNIAALSTYTTLNATNSSTTTNYTLTGGLTRTAGGSANTLKLNTSGTGQSLNLGGFTETISGNGLLFVGAADYSITNGTLTAGNGVGAYELIVHQYGAGNLTIGGVIANNGANAVALTKTGTGTLILNAANTYTGATRINAGTLTIDNNNTTTPRLATSGITVNSGGTLLLAQSGGTASTNRINDSATMTLAGGTFNTGGLSEVNGPAGSRTAGIGALTLTATSTINFGTGSSIIEFAGLGAHTPTSGPDLLITNWSGTQFMPGGTDQLLFAGVISDFTTKYSQSDVSFNGVVGYDIFQITPNYFEVTAVPEPSTWIGGALVFGLIGWTQRKRFARLVRHTV